MRKVVKAECEEILGFLKKDVGKCLYIYLDILEYGISDSIQVWRNETGELRTVLMRYHDSFQVYSKQVGEEKDEVIRLVSESDSLMIYGEKSTVESIWGTEVPGYIKSNGIIHEIVKFRKYERPEGFGIANCDDMYEAAELVCYNEEFKGHYVVKDLEKQYIERYCKGMGRNYYVKRNGEMIAHAATYAENGEIAITSGLVSKKGSDCIGVASVLECCLLCDLLEEGKRIFTFTTSDMRDKYLKIRGAIQIGEYVKLVKKSEV